MRLSFFPIFLFSFCSLASPAIADDEKLNVADPDKHPYADPAKGRENHPTGWRDGQRSAALRFLPTAGGLLHVLRRQTAGRFYPHFPVWARANMVTGESTIKTNTRTDAGTISFVARSWRVCCGRRISWLGKQSLSIFRQTENDPQLTVCFDPLAFSYRTLWKGKPLYHPYRWGTSRSLNLDGDIVFSIASPRMAGAKTRTARAYQGYYVHGKTGRLSLPSR